MNDRISQIFGSLNRNRKLTSSLVKQHYTQCVPSKLTHWLSTNWWFECTQNLPSSDCECVRLDSAENEKPSCTVGKDWQILLNEHEGRHGGFVDDASTVAVVDPQSVDIPWTGRVSLHRTSRSVCCFYPYPPPEIRTRRHLDFTFCWQTQRCFCWNWKRKRRMKESQSKCPPDSLNFLKTFCSDWSQIQKVSSEGGILCKY